MTRLARDRGQAAVEFVLMTPCVIALVLVIVAGSRVVGARGDLEVVAGEAAVAASQAVPGSADTAAQQVGGQVAAGYGLDPGRLQLVTVGVVTRGGVITVLATYRVSLAPMPGSVTLRVTRAEPVDPFRSFG